MRLWTVHPAYLDARGLAALWREGLLAQKVLRGATQGYKHHPQLVRFRAQRDPVAAVAAYLRIVHDEGARRGYRFNRSKISKRAMVGRERICDTEGQLLYEWRHLKRKLKQRDPKRYPGISRIKTPLPHPLFRILKGAVQPWERIRGK